MNQFSTWKLETKVTMKPCFASMMFLQLEVPAGGLLASKLLSSLSYNSKKWALFRRTDTCLFVSVYRPADANVSQKQTPYRPSQHPGLCAIQDDYHCLKEHKQTSVGFFPLLHSENEGVMNANTALNEIGQTMQDYYIQVENHVCCHSFDRSSTQQGLYNKDDLLVTQHVRVKSDQRLASMDHNFSVMHHWYSD